MLQPDNERGRPEAPTRSDPNSSNAATSKQQSTNIVSVSRARHRRKRQYPIASASLYLPVPGRGLRSLSIRCPHCRGVHLGRLRDGAPASGPRRIPCGWVRVVVRRTYRRVIA